ncbi:outer membrane protein assembly factor BamD [bacterium]
MIFNQNYRTLCFLCLSFIALIVISCNKQTAAIRDQTPEQQFEEAKRIFDKKDYYKAKMQFTVIVLNNPGHRIIEQAQFYLGESHFNLKEYIQAIAEYEKLIRSMPQSPFVDDARYKVGLCYFKLSPVYALDQEYTQKAIMQFQLFLEEFPNSDVRPEAEEKLKEARAKLAKKENKTGELYRKMGYFEAAIISFEVVLSEYYDTQFADDALYWKGECHIKGMAWDEAIQSFTALIDRYPSSSFLSRAKEKMQIAIDKKEKLPLSEESQE